MGLYIVPDEVTESKAFIHEPLDPSCGSSIVGPAIKQLPCIDLDAEGTQHPGALEATAVPVMGESSALSEASKMVEAGVGISGMPWPAWSVES